MQEHKRDVFNLLSKLYRGMILIVDLGSQYTHLIKRNCRDMEFEANIVNDGQVADEPTDIEKIILSGGPKSVYNRTPGLSEKMIGYAVEKDIPLLGVCFGHQLLAYMLGGKVEQGKSAEYGVTRIVVDEADVLFKDVPKQFDAWASHFDEVTELPKDFVKLAHAEQCSVEAMRHKKRPWFGLQFHPEVWHTEHGEKILGNFLRI
jgi:GMP synthase (glutamine-hydrolysing)